MRFALKTIGVVFLLYLLCWVGVAAYFSYLERQKSVFENHLTRLFGSQVSIESIETTWNGLSPNVLIRNFRINGELATQPAFAFDELEAELSPWSVFTFWPRFTQFSVQNPELEIVSTDTNRLRVAGLDIELRGSGVSKPKRIIEWLLDQHSSSWVDGEIVWRRQNSEDKRYKEISFKYEREEQNRSLRAAFTGDHGEVAFNAQATGDLLSGRHWDATLEILADDDKPLLTSDGFALTVNDGQGTLKLKQLQIESIRDFMQLSGLSEYAPWLNNANLNGLLHDMAVEFSGPLLSIDDWQLKASASDVSFQATEISPAMDALSGELVASQSGGQFLFSTKDSTFNWGDWFDSPFKIKQASGRFGWRIKPDEVVKISLQDGFFEDQNSHISNLNVSTELQINNQSQRISSFGAFFKVDSVADLDYQNAEIVKPKEQVKLAPIINASADFRLNKVVNLDDYLPKGKKFRLLKKWWSRAFLSGSLSNGRARFQGRASFAAMDAGKTTFDLQADFDGVDIDYGLPRQWPKITQGKGKLQIKNDLLTIKSTDARFGGADVSQLMLSIASLYKPKLVLNVDGKFTQQLDKVVDFIFRPPFVAKEKHPKVLPLNVQSGTADVDISVQIPLNEVTKATVQGSADIKGGLAILPGDVALQDVNGVINFTEKTVSSDIVKARFLGGETVATIETMESSQPLKVIVKANGIASVDLLKPWVGEHLLTVLDGSAPWQGDVVIDGADVSLYGRSNLQGVSVNTPEPLAKVRDQQREMALFMNFAGGKQLPSLRLDYADVLHVDMRATQKNGSLLDQALIQMGDSIASGGSSILAKGSELLKDTTLSNTDASLGKGFSSIQRALLPHSFSSANGSSSTYGYLKEGVNFDIRHDDINLDDWLKAVIKLAQYESENVSNNSAFLDAMRSINIVSESPILLNCGFDELDISLVSADGASWVGRINSENASGTMQLNPRDNAYKFDLSRFNLINQINEGGEPSDVDYTLGTENYPSVELVVNDFEFTGKKFGRLELVGKAGVDAWVLEKFEMQRNGVKTTGKGKWVNQADTGSLSSFDFETNIAEAETALGDFSLEGFIKKGNGTIVANINWIGAPHEFDYSRLNGEFDLRVQDGELVKVEPGGGQLLGLLNFNAVARRLTFDFRDVFSSGLSFDRMQYSGLLADGKVLMRDAYIFTPAVFVRMEGQVDLVDEMIDMEVHISPELGGNIALLSALANPAAGAVVFLTQRVFKDQLRDNNFISFRALGSWEDFELERLGNAVKERSKEDRVSESVESNAVESDEAKKLSN